MDTSTYSFSNKKGLPLGRPFLCVQNMGAPNTSKDCFRLPSWSLNIVIYTLGGMLVAGTDERVTAAQEG